MEEREGGGKEGERGGMEGGRERDEGQEGERDDWLRISREKEKGNDKIKENIKKAFFRKMM